MLIRYSLLKTIDQKHGLWRQSHRHYIISHDKIINGKVGYRNKTENEIERLFEDRKIFT